MAWMSFCFMDNLLPLDSMSNIHHCQMFPLCITTAQDNGKPSCTFKRAVSLRKMMGHLPWRLQSSLIWHRKQLLLPCFLPTPLQNPPRNKIFPIHSSVTKIFSGYIPKEMRLSCWHHVSICLRKDQFCIPSLPVSSMPSETTRQTEKGKELWVLGGKSRYKNPWFCFDILQQSTDLHGRSASLRF